MKSEKTTTGEPELSILICSWNVRNDLERTLRSLFQRDQGLTTKVILVDNGSHDGTVDMVRERYPEVLIIANQANVGFAQANNQALARATGNYVLYLNPDTEVGEGTLKRCFQELAANPDVGMVGCRLLYPDGTIQYECARRAYRLGDLLIESVYLHRFFPDHPVFGRQLMGDWDHQESRDVEAISGAFMMLPRSLAQRLGGMATEVFLYHEDMDLCLRVWQAGYRVRYLAEVSTVHYTSRATVGKWAEPEWALLELETNSRLIRQLQGPVAAVAARFAYGVRSLLRITIAAVGSALPGTARLRERYPAAFNVRRHALQLRWALAPSSVARRLPSARVLLDAPEPMIYGKKLNG